MARIVQDFDLKEKAQMSGRVSGQATLIGKGLELNVLDGDLATADPGGLLEIIDTQYLEGIARSMHQPSDIIVASFKDYHYNKGTLRFSLQKGDLVFAAAFNGNAGKRNIDITLHDFTQRKE